MRAKNILLIALVLGIGQLIQAIPTTHEVYFEWRNNDQVYRFEIECYWNDTVGEVKKLIANALHVHAEDVKIFGRVVKRRKDKKTNTIHEIIEYVPFDNDSEKAGHVGIVRAEPLTWGQLRVELINGKEPNIDKKLLGSLSKRNLIKDKVHELNGLYYDLVGYYGTNKIPNIWHEIKKIESEISHLIHQH